MSVQKKYKCVIVWMRRAMRVQDNLALFAAVQDAEIVVPVLCLSKDRRYEVDSPRRRYIRSAIAGLDAELRSIGSQLVVCYGMPEVELPELATVFNAACIYTVELYDAVGLKRDGDVRNRLKEKNCRLITFKDRVLFAKDEVLNLAGKPFRVYTPYKRAWLGKSYEIPPILPRIRTLSNCGFETAILRNSRCRIELPSTFERKATEESELKCLNDFVLHRLSAYREQRDFPAVGGTSKLSSALALGVLSIRQVYWAAAEARKNADKKGGESIDTFISELIWREFYYQILSNFPYVVNRAFKDDLVDIRWSTDKNHFAAWCEGRTGYPIVDAGMRQLVQEGWMHNRVRMIVASFLTKDLHINWQWGEKFFLEHLCDADIASNNGGWQWSAGTGTDAQPWFRIFNPIAQGEKFDPKGDYVRRYVPELVHVSAKYIHFPWRMDRSEQMRCNVIIGKQYPHPIVDHAAERAVTIALYKNQSNSSARAAVGNSSL